MTEKLRCFGAGDELYETYHDDEWGREVTDSPDERELFERLSLEAFQSGLNWITILRKRDGFRQAFAGFAPAQVAAFDDIKVAELLADRRIVRNRLKVLATIDNAKTLVRLHASGGSLREIIERYRPTPRPHPPLTFADVPSQTPESRALSAELRRHGFRFVGPTTAYAMMQAVGVVNDHIQGCWLAQTQAQ